MSHVLCDLPWYYRILLVIFSLLMFTAAVCVLIVFSFVLYIFGR